MLETEKQRRWWFANHPEYSSSGTGAKRQAEDEGHHGGEKVPPEEVDEYVDYALQHVDGPLAVFLGLIKKNFGTEGQVSSPTMLAGATFTAQDGIWGPYKFSGAGGGGGGLRGGGAGASRGGGGGSSRGGGGTSRGSGSGSKGGSGGKGKDSSSESANQPEPGKWVEKCRGKTGLEHQSKMSGQPIVERNGKLHINEYEVRGVNFDDYRNGVLYEYKGPHGKLLNKDGVFHHWVSGVRKLHEQARRQVQAAEGIPVIWSVGPNQVKAFEKALGRVPGLSVRP
jgi:hypothetical protein